MIEDKWINFVLLNGWRLKAEVDEATGDLVILISNEQGDIMSAEECRPLKEEEIKEVYKLSVNE
jgi:prophage maintenance system killer protein